MLGDETGVFFSPNHFSLQAEVVGTSLKVLGIFDNDFDPMSGLDAEGRSLSFLIQSTPQIQRNARLKIKGVTYQVTSVQPLDDGQITKLQLKI